MDLQYNSMPRKDANAFQIQDPTTIGIIGGGQLGKMIAQEAKRMSMRVVVLDPQEQCPASYVVDEQIIADFKDQAAIECLASKCDVLTYEIELADSYALEELEAKGNDINPSPQILRIIQDKHKQKTYFKENNIPLPDFQLLDRATDPKGLVSSYGLPLLVKACVDSYDGRGNTLIRSQNELLKWFSQINGKKYMVEKMINFRKELSVMVGRNKSGQLESFPVVENIHKNNILETTIVPARVPTATRQKARKIAEKVVAALGGSGIFGVELFLTVDGRILVNEVSPRPHNSGHYTIEACSISQFEQHLRAILDLPLSKPQLLSTAVMVNILGPPYCSGPYIIKGLNDLFSIPGARLHLYGKRTSMHNRKLGHITVTAATTDSALRRAKQARESLTLETL
jgi:5-(carboxyamino)imidazole ribonucleotide synthase